MPTPDLVHFLMKKNGITEFDGRGTFRDAGTVDEPRARRNGPGRLATPKRICASAVILVSIVWNFPANRWSSACSPASAGTTTSTTPVCTATNSRRKPAGSEHWSAP